MPVRIPKRPSQRAVKTHTAFYSGDLSQLPPPTNYQYRKTPKKQAESAINDVIIQTGRLLGAVLYRNRRGMAQLANGGMMPFGLGPAGFPDDVGYTSMVITPEMVGRKVAVFTAVEAKTDQGVVAEHQLKIIEELRDAGCIAGVARNAEDVERLIRGR